MRFTIILIYLVFSQKVYAQKHFSISLENSVGLIQLQERELFRIADRNKYTPRYGLGVSVYWKLFKTDLELGGGFLYSWSNFPVFVGGLPLFSKHREGFPIININNNHWEARFLIKHPFIKNNVIRIDGVLGLDIGFPDFLNRIGNKHEGRVETTEQSYNMSLDYGIYLSNIRNSVAIRSGLNLGINLSQDISVNFTFTYRWGLIQSIDYLYNGKIYINNAIEPLEDSFEKVFSNSGVFLDIGLNWRLF